MKDQSALYIVATPIGNLSDLTARAIDVLKNADLIAAEDTRHSAKLLHHFDIHTPCRSYHDKGSDNQLNKLSELLEAGHKIALISDAGTPLISDPGYKLVLRARELGVKVVPIPGACALIAALSASGMASDKFYFAGFPSAKSQARQNLFNSLKKMDATLIFYESPHRIKESLQDMAQVFGGMRQIVLARELTKTYETFIAGALDEILQDIETGRCLIKGEIVVLVSGYVDDGKNTISDDAEKLMTALIEELPLRKAAAIAAKQYGIKKSLLYDWGLLQKRAEN